MERTERRAMKAFVTDYNNGRFWDQESDFNEGVDAMRTVRVFRDRQYQTIKGFGGAFTEASGWCISELDEQKADELCEAYFGETGLCYNMGRVHIGSCDFALGNYEYMSEGADLSDFDISRDDKYIVPMLRAALNRNRDIILLASPWSPPSYMKTNGDMNHGGQLKKECYDEWAQYVIQFLKEYKKRGIDISMISVQNEPAAVQTWDSCIYSATEEGELIVQSLGPALKEAGLDNIKIYFWDHNKEAMYDRASETLAVPGVKQYIGGVAFHWYTGDHFEAVAVTREAFPDLDLIFTEGCVEYSRFADSSEVRKAEMYAHDILGNLNSGATAIIDWNLVLDCKGGPNHVGNYCAAPVMCTENFTDFEKRLSYYYIGHFSRYIRRGAVRLACSRFTDKLEAAAFMNPADENGRCEYVTVLLNRSEEDQVFTLTDGKTGNWVRVPAHSIMTVIE